MTDLPNFKEPVVFQEQNPLDVSVVPSDMVADIPDDYSESDSQKLKKMSGHEQI